jgi:hypothetical protein
MRALLAGATLLLFAACGGEMGAMGDPGAAGPKGDTGAKGDPGTMGNPGAKGDPGMTGPAGQQGPAGTQGMVGPAGMTGPQGPPGMTGPQGMQGPPGTFDPNQVIANSVNPQTADFNITGTGTIGTSLKVIGPGPNMLQVTSTNNFVTPTALFSANTSLTQSILEVRNSLTNTGFGIGAEAIFPVGPNANQDLALQAHGTGNVLFNFNDGANVGVGIGTPDTKLTVFPFNTNAAVRIGGDAACGPSFAGIGLSGAMANCTNYTMIGDATSKNLYINRPTAATMNFRMNNGDQAQLDTNGGFHVGMSNPNACDLVIADDTCFYDEQNGTLSVRNAAGTAYAPVKASGFVNASSIAYKKDVAPIGDRALREMGETLDQLPLYTYRYKEEPATAPLRTGLIAEEAPSSVLAADGKGVDLYQYTSVAVGAVKAMSKRVADLERENDDLRARLDRLERKMSR